MNISRSMVDAGALAVERVRSQGPDVIAAAVYAAMDEVRVAEGIRAANPGAEKVIYAHKDWPSFRYGPKGEAKVFQRMEDVPKGWSDKPKVDAA